MSELRRGLEDLDLAHTAYRVGYDHGYAAGQMLASVDLARTWLLAMAAADTQHAVDEARRRHGPHWADTIRRQATNPTEGATPP